MADDEKKEDFKDLEDVAFEHGEDTPRGRQERRDYRKGLRRGIGGERTYIENDRHKENR